MIINKESELMALHRAIIEAKFKDSHLDLVIPFSGILAELSERILADIIKTLSDNGENDEAESWLLMTQLNEDWHGYECIKNWIQETRGWVGMSMEDRSKFIKVLCAPYQPSEQQECSLIEFGNKYWKT